jgi:hypothetical protein
MTEVTRIQSLDELQTRSAGRERAESRKLAVEALRAENPLAQNRADSGWALADLNHRPPSYELGALTGLS